MRQEPLNALPADFTRWRIFGERKLCFEEALHFSLRLQMPRGEAFKSFGKDRGDRLVTHQKLSMNPIPSVFVADRRGKHPIAVLDPRFHLLDNLTAVLLALKLALRREDRLHELALGRVIQLEVKAFDPCTARLEFTAQLDVKLGIARTRRTGLREGYSPFSIDSYEKLFEARKICEIWEKKRDAIKL